MITRNDLRPSAPVPTASPARTPEGAPAVATPAAAPGARPDGFDPPLAVGATSVPPRNLAVGPLPLDSAEAKATVAQALAVISAAHPGLAATAPGYAPLAVERDALGMTHVRLARMVDGLPVLGDQVVVHLDAHGGNELSGTVSDIPPSLTRAARVLTAEQATGAALAQFASPTDAPPTARQVIAQDKQGQYHLAYQVECINLFGGEQPRKMNYVVDAQSGQVLNAWNEIDGMGQGHTPRASSGQGGVGATTGAAASGTTATAAEPGWPELAAAQLDVHQVVKSNSTFTTRFTVDQDFPIDTVAVDLDLNLKHRGDLVVTLTSPSGQEWKIYDGGNGAPPDLIKAYESDAFAGGSARGTWTLTVKNRGFMDPAQFNSWGIRVRGQDLGPKPAPAQDDTTLYSGQVQVDTSRDAEGGWTLKDASRGHGVETRSADNHDPAEGSNAIRDADNVWGAPGDDAQTRAGVDAQYGAQMTYDFYRDILGRDSIDGQGIKLESVVHVRQDYDNAFWNGFKMFYGDGDGKEFSPLTTLDIAGHEISHGLTTKTANLTYQGESGALNEAFSDILGKGVEWYAAQRNPAVHASWGVGAQAYTPGVEGDALRYMDDPTRDGQSVDHYSKYSADLDVHFGSGIANNAFVLLAQGGTNRTSGQTVDGGIGMEKALKIFGRALTYYLFPAANFSAARTATLHAARDLYGADSAEVKKLAEAWDAVGVT